MRFGTLAVLVALAIFAGVYGVRSGRLMAMWRNVTARSQTSGATPGGDATSPAPAGASSSAVHISGARQQLIGVRSGTVERQHLDGTTRTVGVLAYDETRTTEFHVKTAGWVDHVFVDFIGKPVKRGQALLSLYSPDLVTAENDYLAAVRAHQTLGGPSAASGGAAWDSLVDGARERLRRLDVSDAEIKQLEANGKSNKTITVYSPFDGIVLERSAFAGQYITPDTSTFKIADLSTIWVVGQAFQLDAQRLRVGAPIEVNLPDDPTSKPLRATIDFVYPDVDRDTRRIRFRASLPNPGLKLKPDTYVAIVFHGEDLDRLVVPEEAVIDLGTRKYVILALADGYFDPRDVEVGPSAGGVYPVISGLQEGDRVVTSAQFLVDSETNLMSAMQNMSMTMPGMDMGSQKAGSTPPSPSATTMPPMPGMPGMAPAAPPHTTATPAPPRAPPPAPPSAPPPARPAPSAMPGMQGMQGMQGMPPGMPM